MKKRIYYTLFILLLIAGCKKMMYSPDDCTTYDYYDCNTTEPLNTEASFEFSINPLSPGVPFELYRGYAESGKLILRDTAYSSKLYYNIEFGIYSVKAEYHIDGKIIYVIDGGTAEKWSNQICDSICWGWDSLHFDLRLH